MRDRTAPSVFAGLDRIFRILGGAPTYLLTDNEKTVTTGHIAGVPVRKDKVCYLFAGWFSGAMDWVGQNTGKTWKTHSEETRCAAEGHDHCVFAVTPIRD